MGLQTMHALLRTVRRPARTLIMAAAAAALGTTTPTRAAPQAQQVAERAREVAQQMALCPIKADPSGFDAGFVQPHAEVRWEATLRNTLGHDVKCVRAAPSCTCTSVDAVGRVVPANGTLKVPLSMKVSGATGDKTAAVVLNFEGVPGIVELTLKATVAYPVHAWQMNPGPDGKPRRDAFVNAFDIKENIRGQVTAESLDGKPFRVLSVNGEPPVFVDPARAAAPAESCALRYDFSSLPCERVPKYLVIETDRPDARLIDLRVRHECTRINPAFAFDGFRENLGVLRPGETREYAIGIKRANGVRIDSVVSQDPRIDARLVDQKPGSADDLLVRYSVTAKPTASGVVIGSLRFAGVGPDPRQPVAPGQPAPTQPRQSDFIVYGKVEAAPPATPAAAPAAPGTPVSTAPAPMRPLPVVARIADSASQVPMDPARYARARAAIDRGIAYLRSAQGPDGGWLEGTATKATDQKRASHAVPCAVTGLAIKAFAQAGLLARDDRTAARALRFVTERTSLGSGFEPDPSSGIGTYVASALLMALAAQQDDALAEPMSRVRGWIADAQWTESDGRGPDSDWFGGYGYGNRGRPDLSNTQLVLDALHEAGASTSDPAVQRALAFVARTQNVPQNEAAWARAGAKDGGFVYTPANGGESFASEFAGEGRKGENLPEAARSLRSYGSMTYAGLKSMLFAGLAADDPRVQAAWGWIRRHYGFGENPGLGQQGRFYYVHTAARALLAMNTASVRPLGADGSEGDPRNWRDDLVDALASEQRPDGSWRNPVDRWMEGEPEMASIYALLALEEALKPVSVAR
jgi:squalene-hopene/tetraprenyl-beta-curcumene cyclase